MPYGAQISRTSPSCFMFLIDQSGSMEDPIAGSTGRKADRVADAINRILSGLIIKCAKSEGVRDYYDVGVLGYASNVGPAFKGELQGRPLVPISEVADKPARVDERTKKVDDGAGGLVEQKIKFPIWFDPICEGGTSMVGALRQAQNLLQDWAARHPDSYPPIVLNITDGEATDGNAQAVLGAAQQLTSLATSDGNVLLFNCHISATDAQSIIFASSEAGLPDEHARLLFQMSSLLPDGLRDAARSEDLPVDDGARGFAFNADLEVLIRFLDIGTRVNTQNLR